MNIINVARETCLKDSFVLQCLGWHDSCYLPPKENSGTEGPQGKVADDGYLRGVWRLIGRILA